MRRMPAEWEIQSAIMMAMPHEESDWYPYLGEARATFREIIEQITRYERCILLVDHWDNYKQDFKGNQNIIPVEIFTNDTWARDFGPLCVEDDGQRKLLDFGFNAWGLKFPSSLDNQINRILKRRGIFLAPLETKSLILEGGSVESNGDGILLTNTQCLLECNRNPAYSQSEIEDILKSELGIKKVLWCNHGYLAGDDTDSHIDTLARFVGHNKIAYLRCEDERDDHYRELRLMEEELQEMRNLDGEPFELFPLPFAEPIYYDGERLPASYANFLFINGAILMPTYGVLEKDSRAIEIMRQACPSHEIIPIDCRVLIRQHGSLHCVTMQLFHGVA
ncbi:MAG: agmatine deiminase family protein [Wolinella sp.]